MNYQELNNTSQPQLKGRKELREWRTLLSRRNIVVTSFSLLLFVSLIANVAFIASPAACPQQQQTQSRVNFADEQRHSVSRLGEKPVYNATQVIECNREFFLFHQDQNHVCEVQNIMIRNDTKVIIRGNNLTTVLHIFSLEVYRLPMEIFAEFKCLKNLIVNGNHLRIIERDTFRDARVLEVLRLSNNDLVELDSYIFRFMKSLKTLDLGRNKIERIDTYAFAGLNSLERLYLSDNNLKDVNPVAFYPLEKLLFLSLENNQIAKLDDDLFKRNTKLKSLGLSNNTFKDLQNECFHYFENLTDLSISELRINSLDLNGTTVQTLVVRNTDLRNLTLSNFPKILVSYGTPIEFLQFIINESTADFSKIPNWGGMFFNKHIRFLFRFKQEIATQDNIERYDNMVRQHEKRPELDYTMNNGTKYLAVEYVARN